MSKQTVREDVLLFSTFLEMLNFFGTGMLWIKSIYTNDAHQIDKVWLSGKLQSGGASCGADGSNGSTIASIHVAAADDDGSMTATTASKSIWPFIWRRCHPLWPKYASQTYNPYTSLI